MSTVWSWILLFIVILLVANVILSGFVVFFERRNPASTWAWLLVLLFIPIFGFFAYMVFGRNSKREKMFREKEKYDQEVYYKYLFQDVHSAEEITEQKAFIENKGKLSHAEYVTDLAHLHLNSGNWIPLTIKSNISITARINLKPSCRISAMPRNISIWNITSGVGTGSARVFWMS